MRNRLSSERGPHVLVVFCLLAGAVWACSGKGGASDLSGGDISFVFPDSIHHWDALPDIPPDLSTKEEWGTDLAAEIQDLRDVGMDKGGVDQSALDLEPEMSEVDSDADELPDLANEADEQGEPDVVVGPCGICPVDKPLCQYGKCMCTDSSCGPSKWCHVTGQCFPCDSSSHCGVTCDNCLNISGSHFCSSTEKKCVVCDDDIGCPQWQICKSGVCESCSGYGLCGPDCKLCEGKTPDCVSGWCSCNSTSCGAGWACDSGMCWECTSTDADHCGPSCLVCGGATPHCKGGVCNLCNTNSSCGASCLPCPVAAPVCRPDGVGCVQCMVDGDCGGGLYCGPSNLCVQCLSDGQCLAGQHCNAANVCEADAPTEACVDDLAPDASQCSKAKRIGRKVVAGVTASYSGSTTDYGGDDDNASSCDDLADEDFYKIYVKQGETIDVTIDPSSLYDTVLKVYSGTDCDNNGSTDMLTCKDSGSGNSNETWTWLATSTGWLTIVVDGPNTSYDYDYGSYALKVKLTCNPSNCGCP